VDLVFEKEAIEAIAKRAIKHKTGARGLRAIIESIMTDIMYEIPSIKGAKKVLVSKEVVENSQKPEIISLNSKKSA
jgi:ATP-dependent Clp protease ATP-binding subunit ClpX